MQREDGFQWIDFYYDFSNKLLEYKNNREELVKLVVEAFNEVEVSMPRLVGDDQEFDDIDPFSVFAFFNKDINKRNELAFALGRKIGVYFNENDLGFKGIPVVFALNALFYNFEERRKSQIQSLWDLYEASINLVNEQSSNNKEQFSNLFDESIKIKSNSVGKMTMALYWIRPNFYLNLDSINSWYVFESATSLVDRSVLQVDLISDICDAKIYLSVNSAVKNSILEHTSFNNLAELSSCAFDDAQAINTIMRDSNITCKSLYNPLTSYINDLPSFWDEEVYKWIALKHFRDNWNLDADNFSDMFIEATSKTDNLLSGGHYLPRETIRQYSKEYPAEVKAAFVLLFDETKPLRIRIDKYIKIFDELKARLNSPNPHHQTANAISTFLWLMYPDKYYIYKQRFVVDCAKVLYKECNFNIGEPSAKILACYEFYNHIRENIKQSSELIDLYNSLLTDDCYNDKAYVSLTNDFARYCSYNKDKLLGDSVDIEKTEESEQLEHLVIPNDEIDLYTDEDFLHEVFMDKNKYDSIKDVLNKKKNIILQGPPGVGKTFCAKRLAYSIMGQKNDNHIRYIQFHQSYSYEDFIGGYRPNEAGGFEYKDGIFSEFCDLALGDSKNNYYLIIDEINRGNISKIFGDIFMLIEADKRGKDNQITLPYSKKDFFIPSNLYLIGTMNTADRSIAIMDYALRRRFAFVDIGPQFDNSGFMTNLSRINSNKLAALVDVVKNLNEDIKQDSSLGENFCIGHSYFVFDIDDTCVDDKDIECIVDYELIPLLKEYWFDDPDKVNEWTDKFRNAIKEY